MIPKVVSQVAYLIIGHDYTITMAAEAGQCEEYIEKSVGISTALCPYIGYAKSAEIAKKSLKSGVNTCKMKFIRVYYAHTYEGAVESALSAPVELTSERGI